MKSISLNFTLNKICKYPLRQAIGANRRMSKYLKCTIKMLIIIGNVRFFLVLSHNEQ